jgi:hypothetical protein
VGDVGIGKDDLIYGQSGNKLFDLVFGVDGDALGLKGARKGWGVTPPFDVGDLSGSEGDDFISVVLAEEDIEIVEIPAGGSGD